MVVSFEQHIFDSLWKVRLIGLPIENSLGQDVRLILYK
jgi:hypothetical protein